MDEIKIEILKCFDIRDIIISIPIFIIILMLKFSWQILPTIIIIYLIIYLLLKSFYIIGISNKEQDKSILFLIDTLDFKESRRMIWDLDNTAREVCRQGDYLINIRFIDNVIYNMFIYKLPKNIIKKLYNYNYVVKLQINNTIENGKNVRVVYSKLEISRFQDKNLEENINSFIEVISKDKTKILEEELQEGIKKYNNFIIPILQFIVATILPLIKKENIKMSEKLLEGIINTSNKELGLINTIIKRLLAEINYCKYCKILKEKFVFSKEELEMLAEYTSNMYRYTGETFYYNNSMAILSFYKRENKSIILRYLEKAKKLSKNIGERITAELNLAFIYFYYREYSRGISKYKNNLNKLTEQVNISKEGKREFLNELRDFINNIEEERKVLGCSMAVIFIDAVDEDVGRLAEEEIAGLASDSDYLKLPLDIRTKFEIEVKHFIYKKQIDIK